MLQQSLFRTEVAPRPDWRPQEPPSLANVSRLALDTESTGLRWYGEDRLVGISGCLPDGATFYLPTGHAGGNLPPERVADWVRQELRGKHLDFFNAPYDINVIHTSLGIDLEAQGCTFSDAGHWAALLDDHRYQSNLDSISREYLGYGKKPDPGVDHMADLHASQVEEYARWDTRLVHDLRIKLTPKMEAEDLTRVLQLENECIPATAEMMRNGAPINEELLDHWLARSEAEYVQSLWDLAKDLGRQVSPRSDDDKRWIFEKCGIPLPIDDEPHGKREGKVTFEKRYLDPIKHPTIQKLKHSMRLGNLRSKYLIPYRAELRKYGKLLYAMHQLRSGDEGSRDSGTVSGRYSSSAYAKTGDGINVQQVAGKKHAHSVKDEADWPYHIRLLFIPETGMWGSADADQIEYRVFSHYAQPKTVMEAYAKDPRTNFHKITHKMISEYKEITYELNKDCNFSGLYMAGLAKFTWMVGLSQKEGKPLYEAYHNAVPEIRQFGKKCMRLAETRGWVKTILGRRARFPQKQRLHAAPNRVVQGSAADEMKTKTVALRREKLPIKLRFIVHDEFDMDVPDQKTAEKVNEVLNRQILPTRVPLTWSLNTGANWHECKK